MIGKQHVLAIILLCMSCSSGSSHPAEQNVTSDISWSTPEVIETSVGDISAPQVGFDDAGNAIAVWSRLDLGWALVSARFIKNVGWTSSASISGNDQVYDRWLRVAKNGDALVAWIHHDTMDISVYSTRFDFQNEVWSGANLIESFTGINCEQIDVNISPNNSGRAVWVTRPGSDPNPMDVWTNQTSDFVNWDSPSQIVTQYESRSPKIAYDEFGNAMLIWTEVSIGGVSIYGRMFSQSQGWQAIELIHFAPIWVNEGYHLVSGPNGRFMIVWAEEGTLSTEIFASFYVPNQGWSSPRQISSAAGKWAWFPQAGFAQNGNVVVIWVQETGKDTAELHPSENYYYGGDWEPLNYSWRSLWATTYKPGIGWSNPKELTPDSLPVGNARLAVEPNGGAVAVWEMVKAIARDDGDNDFVRDLYSARLVSGQGWTDPIQLTSNQTSESADAMPIINEEGNGLVMWVQRDVSGTVDSVSVMVSWFEKIQ